MAAREEPASNVHNWSDDQQSSRGLEVGMMGMTLMTAAPSAGSGELGRPTAAATLSGSSPAEAQQSEQYQGTAPSSPVSVKNQQRQAGAESLLGQRPSPVGKTTSLGQSSKNTSATSPLLTLTPNSSVDGNVEWHALSAAVPALPFIPAEHRRGGRGAHAGFASFDLASTTDNDGLLGLGALRDRSYSSPGPMLSSSPPIAETSRGHVSAHAVYAGENGNDERPRSVPRARPPLSQSYQEGASAHGGGWSSNRSTGSEVSYDSAFGTIGRSATPPEFRSVQSDYDMNRRRASTGDDFYNPYALDPTNVSQKFGSLPTLGSHIQQQRMSGYGSDEQLERPRHIRSVSQPMPAGQVPPRMVDQRYYQQNMMHEGHSYSGGEFRPKSHHASQSHPSFALYDGHPHQKRASVPNMNQSHSYSQFQNLRPDYQESPHSHSQGSVIASAEEIRAFGTPSMISPGHSPIQMYYSTHSRQSSDGSAMLSSSPMSMGGMPRSRFLPHQQSHGDEELAHPLIGEHIEVPDQDDFQGGGMFVSKPHVLPRQPGHGHSMSLDQLPSYTDMHYGGGSILPMPKVVFAVKFKRTQRNFVLGPRINRDLKIGTYVKVEADRGEDLGIVVGKVAADKYNLSSGRGGFGGPPSAGMSMGSGAADLKRIVRLATHDEVSLLSLKREEEDELLRICRTKVRQRCLPMHVIDAEYQFDRHKLTFFFEAEGRVDFRELVRDLFSMYKTRIWMQQIDKSTASSAMAMMAPTASNVQMDFGIPIIAPVSEFADSIVLGGFGDTRSH